MFPMDPDAQSTMRSSPSLSDEPSSVFSTALAKQEAAEARSSCCACRCCAPCSRGFAFVMILLGFLEAVVATVSYSYWFFLACLAGLLSAAAWAWTAVELRRSKARRETMPLYLAAAAMNSVGLVAASILTVVYFVALAEPPNVGNFNVTGYLIWSLYLITVPVVYLVAMAVDVPLTALSLRQFGETSMSSDTVEA